MRPRLAALTAAILIAAVGCTSEEAGKAVGADQGQSPSQQANEPSMGGEPSSAPQAVDPKQIAGIRHKEFRGAVHAAPGQRVAYEESPPFGGAHDQVWAGCNGAVYTKAVRNEHMVHSLEHGAVWIAYNPDMLEQQVIDQLAARVTNRPYTVMSPYPGLDQPISLQSWGFQLKVSDPQDPRIDQFITALRQNQATTPEPGAPCDPHPEFDQDDPPPFEASPPGKDAMPESG